MSYTMAAPLSAPTDIEAGGPVPTGSRPGRHRVFETAGIPLLAARWVPFQHEIEIEGVDLATAQVALQIRDRKDGDRLLAALSRVDAPDSEGLRVTSRVRDKVPITTVHIHIAETTMEAIDVARERGEPGGDAVLWWDLHVSPASGVKFVAFEGSFIVRAGVTR